MCFSPQRHGGGAAALYKCARISPVIETFSQEITGRFNHRGTESTEKKRRGEIALGKKRQNFILLINQGFIFAFSVSSVPAM
jgi:hypothetical protein